MGCANGWAASVAAAASSRRVAAAASATWMAAAAAARRHTALWHRSIRVRQRRRASHKHIRWRATTWWCCRRSLRVHRRRDSSARSVQRRARTRSHGRRAARRVRRFAIRRWRSVCLRAARRVPGWPTARRLLGVSGLPIRLPGCCWIPGCRRQEQQRRYRIEAQVVGSGCDESARPRRRLSGRGQTQGGGGGGGRRRGGRRECARGSAIVGCAAAARDCNGPRLRRAGAAAAASATRMAAAAAAARRDATRIALVWRAANGRSAAGSTSGTTRVAAAATGPTVAARVAAATCWQQPTGIPKPAAAGTCMGGSATAGRTGVRCAFPGRFSELGRCSRPAAATAGATDASCGWRRPSAGSAGQRGAAIVDFLSAACPSQNIAHTALHRNAVAAWPSDAFLIDLTATERPLRSPLCK